MASLIFMVDMAQLQHLPKLPPERKAGLQNLPEFLVWELRNLGILI